MANNRCFLLLLWVLILQAWQIQPCTVVTNNSDEIKFALDKLVYYTNFGYCWHIKLPPNKYVILTILELKFSEACQYQFLEIKFKGSNEIHTFCEGDMPKYSTTSLTDVAFKFTNKKYGARGHVALNVEFAIRDIECMRDNIFHCSNDSCIPQSEVCDGVKDCENGFDEVGCEIGVLRIKGVKEARLQEIASLKSKLTFTWGWNENTPRAVLALFLAGGVKMNGTILEEELIAKQVELKTSIALQKNPLEIEHLSMFINGLLVTCHNPRHFHGQNLIRRLKEQVESSGNFTHPIAYLTLCNAKEPLSSKELRKISEILSRKSDYPFVKDYQAIAVMAVSCFENNTKFLNRTENSNIKTKYESAIQNFKQTQQRDGSFGNLHTTSLVTQALISSGQEYAKDWNLNATIQYLLQKLAAPHDSLASYMILPVLNAKSLSDVANVNCTSNPRKVGLENFASEIKDYAVPKLRIQYSIFEGDQRDVIHTISIRVPENYTAFDVMVLAEKEDAKFNFKYTKTSGILYVHQIGTVTNDPESGLFWMLYQGLDYTNTTNNLNHLNLSPDQHVMQDKEHLVMWYKKAHI